MQEERPDKSGPTGACDASGLGCTDSNGIAGFQSKGAECNSAIPGVAASKVAMPRCFGRLAAALAALRI